MADRISEAFLEIEKLKLQIERIKSHVESESGTLERMAKLATTELKISIEKIELDFKEIIYNSETGLQVKIDRLVQESKERRVNKQNIVGLWIAVGLMIIAKIIEWLSKLK